MDVISVASPAVPEIDQQMSLIYDDLSNFLCEGTKDRASHILIMATAPHAQTKPASQKCKYPTPGKNTSASCDPTRGGLFVSAILLLGQEILLFRKPPSGSSSAFWIFRLPRKQCLLLLSHCLSRFVLYFQFTLDPVLAVPWHWVSEERSRHLK